MSDFAMTPAERRRLFSKQAKTGHVAPPGTGPASETCGSCRHIHRERYSKVYLKCALNEANWTKGPGSDIRAKDAACYRWGAA